MPDDTEVVDALLREYMKRNGMPDALASFDGENPRTDASISSTGGIVRALATVCGSGQLGHNITRPVRLLGVVRSAEVGQRLGQQPRPRRQKLLSRR